MIARKMRNEGTKQLLSSTARMKKPLLPSNKNFKITIRKFGEDPLDPFDPLNRINASSPFCPRNPLYNSVENLDQFRKKDC